MFLSPDGKYLAFDLPSKENPAKRDVFVLPVEGNREMIPAVVHPANDAVMGWSPDGSRLLFSSDRTGAVGLWAISISNGTPQGSAELIKAEIGAVSSLGLTASGAFYFGSKIGGVNVQVASIDFITGQLLSPPVNPIPDYLGANSLPDWSPDGKFLSYLSQRGMTGLSQVIVIRSLQSGQMRELRPQLRYLQRPRWSPDGRSFAVPAYDLKGRQGIFLIDAQNGEASPIVLSQPGEDVFSSDWGPDGTKIYYRRARTGDKVTFVERDLVSGAE
jgi:Tol biopolymer transport system component